jgi:hypothetical protein
MAQVRLEMHQVQRDGFPPVCAACGAPATAYRRRWFVWTPGRSVPFALFGYWRYCRVTLDVPFCAAHQTYFTRRWAPLLTVALLAVGAGVAAYITTDVTRGPAQAQALRRVLIPAVGGVVALIGVIGTAVKWNSIRVIDVAGDEFTLAGVCDEFAASVAAGPAAEAVVLAAAEDEPPVVLAVSPESTAGPAPRRRPPPVLRVQPARRRGGWLVFLIILACFAVLAGGLFVAFRGGLFGGGSPVRLSNGRVTGRLGMLVNLRADYRVNRPDANGQYVFIVRAGGSEVGKRPIAPGELKSAGSLDVAVAVLPNATAGPFEGVIEAEKPDGSRERVSNVIRLR